MIPRGFSRGQVHRPSRSTARAAPRLGAALTLSAAAWLWAGLAHAAGPLGQDGSDIRTSDYSVDLYQGPVTSSSRIIGLGGAYVGIAEGVEGLEHNPAAAAVRTPWSVDSFDYDLSLGLTFPSSLRGTDFYNTGQGTTDVDAADDGFVFFTPAVAFQDGGWGYGISAALQNFQLSGERTLATESDLTAQFAEITLVTAYGFDRQQFSLGVGVRSIGLTVARQLGSGATEELFVTTGIAPVAGVLWRPNGERFRVGAAFKFAVETEVSAGSEVTENPDGDLVLGPGGTDPASIWLPRNLRQPWEASLGLVLQLGPRPLNPAWTDPERELAQLERYLAWRGRERQRRLHAEQKGASAAEREALAADAAFASTLDALEFARQARALRELLKRRSRQLARSYVLISTELQVVGSSESAVGVESFIERKVSRAGDSVTVGPRLGVETEAVPNWLKLRAGTYGEPSRFKAGSNRLHATLGFDLKLFPWSVFGLFDEGTQWRVGGALDAARRYFGWSASLGVWH